MKLIEVENTYKKGKSSITIKSLACPCGGTTKLAFSFSSGHCENSYSTYVIQCLACKLIYESSRHLQDDEFVAAGWKKVNKS